MMKSPHQFLGVASRPDCIERCTTLLAHRGLDEILCPTGGTELNAWHDLYLCGRCPCAGHSSLHQQKQWNCGQLDDDAEGNQDWQ